MTTEHDAYGMTPEERAAYLEWERSFSAWGITDEADIPMLVWAACAKLNREQLFAQNQACRWAGSLLDTALADIDKLQIGHNALQARIKELEAENALLKTAYGNAEYEFGEVYGRTEDQDKEIRRLRADAERFDFPEEAVPDFRDQVDQQMKLEALKSELGQVVDRMVQRGQDASQA